jgi:hypothetical protein
VLYQSLIGGRRVHAKEISHDRFKKWEENLDQVVKVKALLIDHVLIRLHNLLQSHQT